MKKYKPYFHEESGITFKSFQQVREYIWETREHVSEISGDDLFSTNHAKWHFQFLHLLNRYHTYWVLNPDNVILGTPDEHDHQESYKFFLEKQQEAKEKYHRKYSISNPKH